MSKIATARVRRVNNTAEFLPNSKLLISCDCSWKGMYHVTSDEEYGKLFTRSV